MNQRSTPLVSYEDVASAIAFLVDAFGFVEVGERITDGSGRVTHAELDREGARVFVGWPGADYRDPVNHAATCADARRWLDPPWVIDGVHVTVKDVETHHTRAVDAGRASCGRRRTRRPPVCTRPRIPPATGGCSCSPPTGRNIATWRTRRSPNRPSVGPRPTRSACRATFVGIRWNRSTRTISARLAGTSFRAAAGDPTRGNV